MRNPGKRVKSRSVVASVAPCSMASAAKWASMISGPWACPLVIKSRRISQCRSPGFRTVTEGSSVERPFNLLDEFPDTVVVEPRAQAEGSCLDFERWEGGGFAAGA